MDRFRRRENIQRFRLRLAEIVADESERERALKLLAEQRQKQKDAATLTEIE
jgi:hypothetical protein